MAKRTNPFTDAFMPQCKVHIGAKQFNNNEDRLKKVYEKTLNLLYKGAKKQCAIEESSELPNIVPESKEKMKQLFIGKDGSLIHSGTMAQSSSLVSLECGCGVAAASACSYCDKALCAECRHFCECCDKFYCSCCSFTGSEGSKICVSCYG
ncbi:apoptosis regulatory protein Siva [Ostrinia furnacalis]|uniref:apoptosis regulatory protein Siva n=1 Tax=Ostrinia furnacalis TaxID=93504 RepID=UPI00103E3FCF|nr:apoptosis regulatory protein Siva [Ostrinia furnacalis]